MTYAHFRDVEVQAYLAPVGFSYVQIADQDPIIRRQLEQFTEETLCLYDDDIAFTTSATDSFDLRDTATFAYKIIKPQAVFLNHQKIPMMATASDMALANPNYHQNVAGTPSFWFTQGSSSLVFDRDLTGVIANSYVAGWFLHPTLDDEDDLFLEDTDVDDAAVHVACAIMRPYATTGEVKAHRDALLQENIYKKEQIRKRSRSVEAPLLSRRRKPSLHALA